jgi:hypothetical protein
MRPASRRALLRRIAAASHARGLRPWPLLILVAAAIGLAALLVRRGETPPPPVVPAQRSAPPVDPVLALPFGEGAAAPVPLSPGSAAGADPASLRAAYWAATDRARLYREWRERPEPDARYLAFRAARDCELVLAGEQAERDEPPQRRSERERRIAASVARCQGFIEQPLDASDMSRLQRDVVAAGHPAARMVGATDAVARRPLAETIGAVRGALASADPLAYDEARVLLAMLRHQVEVAGQPPTPPGEVRQIDSRVVAIDLAGCLLGNPCGPSTGLAVISCGADAACQRDAQEWLLQSYGLQDDERMAAIAMAERIAGAFRRGAVDEILRAPAGSPPAQ